MRTSITKRLRYEHKPENIHPHRWYVRLSNGIELPSVSSTLKLKPPKQSFRVRYTLSQRGLYKVRGMYLTRGRVHASVCFLPPAWEGKRVNREVLSWR